MPPTRPVPTNIAIVEDDAGICEDLAQMIRETGDMACACVCRNGRAALHKIPRCPTDIVIMDIQLPDSSGFQICQELRKRSKTVILIMMTGRFLSSEEKKQGFELGADEYITKPFDLAELSARIKQLLSRNAPRG